MNNVVSEIDVLHLQLIRENVSNFIKECSKKFDKDDASLLDVAPQVHAGAKAHFIKSKIFSLDIDPNSKADFIADLCCDNSSIIEDDLFDTIICTEVLEHTLNPFLAVKELKRIIKKGGHICISVPFNFRIHGPLPDCWRFTEHGLRALFKDLTILQLDVLESADRFLMPIHYTLVATK